MFPKSNSQAKLYANTSNSTEDDDSTPRLQEHKMKELYNDNSNQADLENDSMSDHGEDDELDETGTHENLQDAAARETRESLAREETRAVSCLRWVVLLVLLATAASVSVITFFYSRRVEEEQFLAEFASVAAMTLRSFVEAVEHKMGAMDTMATGITSYALASGETFPNVTVPDYEIKGASIRTQTDSIYSFWLPLVTDETRAGYEAYCWPRQQHFLKSYMQEEGLRQYQDAMFNISRPETRSAETKAEDATAKEEQRMEQQQQQQKHDHGDGSKHTHGDDGSRRDLHVAPPPIHETLHERIWGLTHYGNGSYDEPEGSGPFLPTWQFSPVIPMPGLYNYNFLAYTDLAPVMRQTIYTGRAGLSYLQTNHTGSNTERLIQIFMTLNQYRHTGEDYTAKLDPLTQVTYPVFDTFHPQTKKVAGMLTTTIFWRLLFANILPASVNGVVCVLSNTLGDAITYRIDGRNATLLGVGDLHDPKYSHMGVTRDIADYMRERATPESSSYTIVPLDTSYTSYRIQVYPSQALEDAYITDEPILYATVVACVFFFTSAVFLLYDWLVERRQRKVMDKAVKSTAVVTSLFPAAVHERLFAEDTKSEELSKEINTWRAASADMSLNGGQPTVAALMSSVTSSRGRGAPTAEQLVMPPRNKKSKPIADKFPDTTVLFADLAGFTQWSSSREPEHVFILLETLYGAFDKVALRREVFKVETIGDCYMAVTGLPNPQPDHAVRMVKFARDCMNRMVRALEDLQMQLGPDTRDLAMRVGLHSGPVTAGVLRGDKGRFQLFGDTVNTASRMESNGVKGRIHCSEATAKLLPDRWLKVRPEKVVAKGKGEMTTYFVDIGNGARSSVASERFNVEDGPFINGALTPQDGDHTDRNDLTERNMDGSSYTFDTSNRRSSLDFNSKRISGDGSSAPLPIINQESDEILHDYGQDLSGDDDILAKKGGHQRERRLSLTVKTSSGRKLNVTNEVEV
ncbi:Receptor-type guanylate cyclase gcy [Seminavis robusta]|uniref:Receptor-type guanylate cyclase gcy n=1 Tax=Seminavis robusta TaxID=568900 RepID=A0A9N8HQZ0_9STRA|nr:Receptor-type guanylate cyclase gcy [Seminavis robusta]|eukprot:Sro1502_g278000.1 Receptor-type guanylate cyclase gcy (975) ;mRNA; r:19649-23484